MQSNYKIFLIAGEASGDANGALLIEDIIKSNPGTSFSGIGGSKLKSKNVNIIQDYSEVNYIGFSNVIKNINKIKSILKNTVEYVKKQNPDLIILIDFPGFNLKFAELIRRFYKGRVLYYISPQIWAWHKNRIKKIKRYIDRLMVIFPFEVDFYKKLEFNVEYVGHPLVEKTKQFLSHNKKTESENIRICLLPGSRIEEILRIFPVLANSSEVLRDLYNAEINLIYPEYIDPNIYKNILKGRYCNLIPNTENNHFNTLLNSDLVLTKFGTTTLELSLLNTPFISVYKAGFFNYSVAKFLSDLKFVSMPNILAGRQIVKEYIQFDMTAENIIAEAKKIISDKKYRDNMLDGFKEVQDIFKNTKIEKSASEIIIEELSRQRI